MTTILGLMILLLVRDIHVDTVSLCDDWRYLEVIEKSDDNTFTCTGLREEQEVVWFWNTFRVATCPPPTSTCTVFTSTANKFFRFSRTSTTASNITVLATAAQTLDYFGQTSLTCEISAQESVVCPLDSVYPAENITCKIQFNEDTWDVTSWCVVSKVRSTRNKYGCYLYQTQGSQESIRVGSYNMSTVGSTLSNYSSGTCNMTSYLPSDGRYSYTVLIMPGEVNVPAVFYGSNEIRRPKSIPVHNCPLYVKEDSPVGCVCSVDDVGSPPGQLTWNNTSSEQLTLPGVKKDQHGVNYVCSLTWNRTVVQSVTYTLLVAYPPTQMSFKVNNTSENVVVTEKSPVTMLCQSDGRPTPNMTITDVTNSNRVLHSQPGGNVTLADHRVQTRYDKVVECEDTGEYRCTADNIIGSRYQAVKLFVMCAPRRIPVDANYTIPAVAEGKSVTIELIAYPTSVNVTKYFLGPNISGNEQPAKEGVFVVMCNASPSSSYKIRCNISVINVTSDTVGFYKVIVINQAGNVSFAFQALPLNDSAHEEGTTTGNNSEDSSAGAIAGGVVGGVVVVGLVAIAVVCFVRRKGNKNNSKNKSQMTRDVPSKESDNVLTTNAIYESSDTRPLASAKKVNPQSSKGTALSMLPVTESAYENEAFRGETAKKEKNKGKGAEEARRRNDEGLLYTTVVFSNSSNTQPKPQQLEPTEYATIRQARDQ